MKLGARSLKTGLAVAISIILAQLLNPQLGVIAGISAVASTQPSVARSYKYMKERLVANLIGGTLAALIAATIGTDILIIGLTSVLLIAILNYLKLGNVISTSVVTMVIIMLSSSDNLLFIATLRITETFIGVLVAFFINSFIHPPKYDGKLFHTVDYASNEFLIWLRASLRKNTDFSIMNDDLKWAREQLVKMDMYFQFLQESKMPFQKTHYHELRQLVIYRRMIESTRSAYKLLNVIHDYENVFFAFPYEMRVVIRERLETLMSGHEQIMLKFSGRVSPGQVKFFESKQSEREELMGNFFNFVRNQDDSNVDFRKMESYGSIHIMSAILNYEDELVRFNKLVSNYRRQISDEQISNIDDIVN